MRYDTRIWYEIIAPRFAVPIIHPSGASRLKFEGLTERDRHFDYE